TKIPLYAEANIKEVWIVNLKEECLEVYRHPLNGSYQAMQKYSINERVFMTSFHDIEFTIAEILGV
ncbi:MAG: Uma2 family endonuclease, partial [Microcystis sp. M53603_WE2]